jgi:hypothetical protein
MITVFRGRKWIVPTLAGVLLGCLAATSRGDETQYFPDGANVVLSYDVQKFLKSKTFEELKKLVKQLTGAKGKEVDIEKEMAQDFGIPLTVISRKTVGARMDETAMVGILTTAKPMTPADIIAVKNPRPYQVNVKYPEVKVGPFTVYEENYQTKSATRKGEVQKTAEVQKGEAFCMVEGKTMLFGRLREADGLKKVLQRKEKPQLSALVQAGLKQAPLTNAGVIVMEFKNMTERDRKELFQMLGMPKLEPMSEALAVTANEKDKVSVHATLFCKDAAAAGEAKKLAETRLTEFKGKLNDVAKVMPMIFDGAGEILKGVRLSTKGSELHLAVSGDPAACVKFVLAFGMAAKLDQDQKTGPPTTKGPPEKK